MSLDQFYTKPEIAKKYYNIIKEKIDIELYDIILEPSAGNGAFYNLFDKNKRVGIDIDPKNEKIIRQNFFDFVPKNNKKYIVIGNPPFGRVSSTAIKFFNKSSEFAEIICFILPRTFKRVSVQNKLNLYFHNIYEEDVPLNPCCFEPKMDAKCVFQIWQKHIKKRKKVILKNEHTDFSFVNFTKYDEKNQPIPPTNADFVIKAYGSNCGKVIDKKLNELRPKSWHWIKANIDINELKKRFSTLDYSISKDTVRQDSIGRKEVIFLYEQKFN